MRQPKPRKDESRERVVSKSGLKVLDVLQVIGISPQLLGLTEIAAELDLDKTTASRMLATLSKRGFIKRHPANKKYMIGPEFLAVSSAVTSRSELLRITHPTLTALRESTGETVSFHLRIDDQIVRLNTLERFPPDLERQRLGMSVPLYAGTAGVAVLAFLQQHEIETILAEAVEAGFDRDRIQQQSAFVRSRGYLGAVSELRSNLGAVSAPLFSNGVVFGAIAIAGPLERMPEARREEIGLQLKEKAAELSATVSLADANTYQD